CFAEIYRRGSDSDRYGGGRICVRHGAEIVSGDNAVSAVCHQPDKRRDLLFRNTPAGSVRRGGEKSPGTIPCLVKRNGARTGEQDRIRLRKDVEQMRGPVSEASPSEI